MGLITADCSEHLFTQVSAGAEIAARERGYFFILLPRTLTRDAALFYTDVKGGDNGLNDDVVRCFHVLLCFSRIGLP